MSDKSLYGVGWHFPPSFGIDGPRMVQGDAEDVRQSLHILFSTLPGERIMRSEYGCDLSAAMFEPINDVLLAELNVKISESILRYEQRVVIDSLELMRDESCASQIQLILVYRIRGTRDSQRFNGRLNLLDDSARSWL